MNDNVEKSLRLCKLFCREFGYFHCWTNENRAETLVENGIIKPIGITSHVFGIVELEDRVVLVEPEDIHFVDDIHAMLVGFNKDQSKKKEAV